MTANVTPSLGIEVPNASIQIAETAPPKHRRVAQLLEWSSVNVLVKDVLSLSFY